MVKKLLIAVALIYSVSCSLFANDNPTSPENILVYSTIQPSYWEIYLFENGKSKPLTQGQSLNYNPTFSPDGQWLVFTSEKTGTGFLYAIDLKNSHAVPTRLTKGTV